MNTRRRHDAADHDCEEASLSRGFRSKLTPNLRWHYDHCERCKSNMLIDVLDIVNCAAAQLNQLLMGIQARQQKTEEARLNCRNP